MTGMIVMSLQQGDHEAADYTSGKKWRYLPESRIVAMHKNTPEEPLIELTNDFFSACTPKISYDGDFMLFAAQKNQNDVWQIWEMNLSNLKKRQITSSEENCIDPDYLPGERMVFSKQTTRNISKIKTEHTLFTCDLDGSNLNQITYDPSSYFASTVLNDGRVVAISKELLPEKKDGIFMIMRPDGTKQELFYQSKADYTLHSRVWEMNNGKIVFIESDLNNNKDIVSISYSRPLHSRENLTSKIEGDFYAISPYSEHKVITSYRPKGEDKFGLYEFDIKSHEIGKQLYKNGGFNVMEAIIVEKSNRPRKLPSEVDLNVKTALLVCQDINFSYSQQKDSTIPTFIASRMEILGIDSTMATFNTEKDGSFYIKILADTPFKMQSIDENNNVVKGPSNWLYLRPNERRGCVGCHENKELVPKNVQPLAVKKEPVQVPSIGGIDSPKTGLKK